MNNTYDFTNGWFNDHVPVWDQIIPQLKPKKILEIGSFEGRSACYLIEKSTEYNKIELHCIDTWEGGTEHQKGERTEAVMSDVETRFHKNITIAQNNAKHSVDLSVHKKLSSIALAGLIALGHGESFDLIYVDGAHQAPDVLTDATMAFQLLRVGGLLIFDDYLWYMEDVGQQDVLNMPKLAIDAFTNIFQRKMRIMPRAPIDQLYVEKVFK